VGYDADIFGRSAPIDWETYPKSAQLSAAMYILGSLMERAANKRRDRANGIVLSEKAAALVEWMDWLMSIGIEKWAALGYPFDVPASIK